MDTEDWHEYKKMGQEKRRNNRLHSAVILDENSILYDTHNGGAHLVVRHNGFIVDFWPGTGKYSFRGSQKYKRGVHNLIKDLK
jgi:hypothetical protein